MKDEKIITWDEMMTQLQDQEDFAQRNLARQLQKQFNRHKKIMLRHIMTLIVEYDITLDEITQEYQQL